MKKLLYLTEHLSTGGMPQFLLKKIEQVADSYEVFVIEYKNLSDLFTVQKKQIKNLIKPANFFTLSENKLDLIKLIDAIKPDIIHLTEIPEMFLDSQLAKWLYRPDRNYLILETTHTSDFDVKDKVYLPDKFIFVCPFSAVQYANFGVDFEIIEYPVETNRPIDKDLAKEQLELDKNLKHIVVAGLFTPRKNQGYAFQLARQLIDTNVQFHFVGNQAENFAFYWKPLIENKPANCKIWGERSDVSTFLRACDLSLFPSQGRTGDRELNPLIIKESLENRIPILMYNLDVYLSKYQEQGSISFLTGDIAVDAEKIKKILGLKNEIKSMPVNSILDAYTTISYNKDENKIYLTSQYSQTMRFEACSVKEIDSEIPIYFWRPVELHPGGSIWVVPVSNHNFHNDPFCNGFVLDFYDRQMNLVFRKSIRIKPQTTKVKIPSLSPFDCLYINYREFFGIGIYDEFPIDHLEHVIDAGANVGLFSAYMKLQRNAQFIYCVEPDPKALGSLLSFADLRDEEIVVFPFAVGPENKTVKFSANINNSTISKISETGNLNVEQKTLETLFGELEKVSLLKMDIEGSEYSVIDSMSDNFLQKCERILIEFHDNDGTKLKKMYQKLTDAGFKIDLRKQSSKESCDINWQNGLLFAIKL